MRTLIWFLLLAAAAVGLALFAADNNASVALFWPPYRVRISLNLAVLLLLALFALLYIALRALSGFLALPTRAQEWRSQYHERAQFAQLQEAITQFFAGRFSRARKAAELLLAHQSNSGQEQGQQQEEARTQSALLAHMLIAESAHHLRDAPLREQHTQRAQELCADTDQREAVALRAAAWALDEQDAQMAWQYLRSLPQGAQRRVHALRLKLRAARMSGQPTVALETARLLAKHGAFAPHVAQTLLATLACEVLNHCHDSAQLQHAWNQLHKAEQNLPQVLGRAAQRMLDLHAPDEPGAHEPAADSEVPSTDSAQRQAQVQAERIRTHLLPLWKRYDSLPAHLQEQVVDTLTRALAGIDKAWLTRIEEAAARHPRDAGLHYLAGAAYVQLGLWGKAQQALTELVRSPLLAGVSGGTQLRLLQRAWHDLGMLAEQRGDMQEAAQAWRRAAQLLV